MVHFNIKHFSKIFTSKPSKVIDSGALETTVSKGVFSAWHLTTTVESLLSIFNRTANMPLKSKIFFYKACFII